MTSLFNNTYDNTVVPAVETVTAPPVSKKRGWLPLLTVLFLISYALMTMLIIEQGQTIDSQRVLIRELFRDSTELSAVKQAEIAKRRAEAQTTLQTPASKTPSTQIQSNQSRTNQLPTNQVPTKQAPSSQAATQRQAQRTTQKPEFQMPSRPASDVIDENRSLITI